MGWSGGRTSTARRAGGEDIREAIDRRKNIEIRASEGKRVRETERESKQRGVTRVKDRARSKFNARKERDREISGEVIDILRRIETKRREEMIGSGQKVDSSR